MKTCLRRLTTFIVALCGLLISATAQQIAWNPGAADAAARNVGTVASRSGGRLISHALYVSLRTGGRTLDDAIAIARRAGLDPMEATPLSFVRNESEKSRRASLQSLPRERRDRVASLLDKLARVVELRYAADVHPEEAARRLMGIASIDYAEPVPASIVESPGFIPNDPLITDQQHLERIKAYEAWDVWPGDSNTVIGIVDAGIDNTHEDLAPNIKENRGEEGLDATGKDKRTNRFDDDGNGVIDDWRGANMNAPADGSTPGDTRASQHGTAVAGAAAAATNNGIGIAGVANRCQMFPVKTMPIPSGPLTMSYAGMEYCAMSGFSVVNCSFGDRDFSRTKQTFITMLIDRYDIAIVAAGGNDLLYDMRYPAGYRGVFGVGALNEGDGLSTTYGEQIDVTAPVGMMTGEANTYVPGLIATSFSSPVAAGVVALARSKWPELSAVQALAHVRLTSDTLPAVGDMYRLTGYGRVNALRAVSVDPLTHPGIIVDTMWLTDPLGAPRETFTLGERGTIRLRLHNLLGPAQNVRVRIVDYRDADDAVTIDSSWHDAGSISTDGVLSIAAGFPFELVRVDTNRLKLRVEITADGGYADYDFASSFVYLDRPSIAVYVTSQIALSVSSRGNIGYADYPENGYGIGVMYDNQSFLFEGGFLAASAPTRVVNNVRGASASYQDRDFAAIGLPADSNAHTLTLVDALAGEANEIGLELRVQTIVNEDVPNAFATRVRARNIGGALLDSLRVGMFADWDLAGEGDAQAIVTRDEPASRVPLYAVVSGRGYFVATGTVMQDRAAIHYAIDNAGTLNLYQNFNQAKKWHTLSNGVGSRTVGPTDVSIVTGRVLTGLERDDEDTLVFVVGIGKTESEAVTGMQAIAGGTASAISFDASHARLIDYIRPNPVLTRAIIDVDLRGDARIALYDALGGLVVDLTDRIPDGGAGSIALDVRGLAAGIYIVRASDERGSMSKSIAIVR